MARVLIVDDALIMRKTLCNLLEQAGHTVVAEATHGVQAYNNYEKHRPDLVTMDINMPGMNGLDTITKIMKNFPDACIIVISAFGTKTMILEALERGAKHYILKPINAEKVAEAMKIVLGGAAQAGQKQ